MIEATDTSFAGEVPALQKTSAPNEKGSKKGRKNEPKADGLKLLNDVSRSLPFSNDAEKSVLSCMMQRPDELISAAVEKLTDQSFYVPANRLIFNLLKEAQDQNKAIDPVTVTQMLIDRHQLDQVGGPSFISELYGFTASTAHFDYYVKVVDDKHTLRDLINACSECITEAYSRPDQVDNVLDQSERRVLSVRENREKGGEIVPLRELTTQALDEIEAMLSNPNRMMGVATGLPTLDNMLHGMQEGDLFIIAARPSMGKTSFMMNIVEYVAADLKIPVAVFSLEMSAKLIVRRLLVSRAQISMSRLQGGLLEQADQGKLMRAVTDLSESNILIDDTPGISIDKLKAKARRFKKQHKIGLIAVDYLQLVVSDSPRARENRQLEISEVSAGLKAIAKELKLPIICLAQLSREVEKRKGSRPILSDLRESGSIEQDADVVAFLTRDDYAGTKGNREESQEEEEASKGRAVLIIAKHRNGPTGDVPLKWVSESMKFFERPPDKFDEAE